MGGLLTPPPPPPAAAAAAAAVPADLDRKAPLRARPCESGPGAVRSLRVAGAWAGACRAA